MVDDVHHLVLEQVDHIGIRISEVEVVVPDMLVGGNENLGVLTLCHSAVFLITIQR